MAGVLILVTVLVLTPLFKDLPEAVLAALIIHAVAHLMKVRAFRAYYGQRRIEFLLGLATLLGVITLDVLPGLLIGVLSMLLLVVYQASRLHLAVLGRVPDVAGAWGDVERHPDYVGAPALLVLRLEGPVFYANATLVRDRIKYLVGAAVPLPRAVILDVGANHDIDITTAEVLAQLIRTLRTADVDFALAEARGPVVDRVRRTEIAGLISAVGEDRIFHTIDEAVRSLGSSTPRT
jgi:sulfate permease, SulP family